MTAVAPLRPVDLARDLQELATLVGSEQAVDDVLRRGLDWLARVAPYDLATVFVLEQGRLVVRAARGPLADDRVRQHALSLEQFPSIREALETRRARTFLEQDHRHGDGDPFDHVLDLPPGHACLVAPLVAGDQTLGVLTLDRTVCEVYPPPVVNLVEVYAQLLAIAMQGAGKTVTLERLHQQDHVHAKLMEEELGGGPELEGRIRSAGMQALLRRARQVARAQTPVLIRGEPGSGKERLARAIHAWSERAEHPFVSLSCAAVPDGALELELFGHVEGAFAGVGRARPGRLVVANGGTLFLDEVSELPLRAADPAAPRPAGRRVRAGGERPPGAGWTCGSSPRRTPTSRPRWRRAGSARTSSTSSTCSRSSCRRCASAARTWLRSPRRCSRSWPAAPERRRGGSLPRRWPASRRTTGPGTCASWPTCWSARSSSLRARSWAPRSSTCPAGGDGRAGCATASSRRSPTPPGSTSARVLQATRGRIYGPGGAAEILGLKPSTLQSKMKKLGLRREPTSQR